jgi:hypothetical protein
MAAPHASRRYSYSVRIRWEYARLTLTCDPGVDTNVVHGYLGLPGTTSWMELGVIESQTNVINDLGREGWELVGPPNDVNSVYTYKSGNETWHDRASFVERNFWLKRPAGNA